MSECRDWLATLWPASFKGVPFFFESDEEETGRGLVVHEFPMRDVPFVEDLGEATRTFSGTAYLTGDDADGRTAALMAAFASRGQGVLTVPIRGPVPVHCKSARRQHSKDQLGYVAFDVDFIRAGAAAALGSVGLLASLVFAAADRLAAVTARHTARKLRLRGRPDHVVAKASLGIQRGLATVEALRLARPVAPVAAAKIRDAVSGSYALVPVLVARTDPPDAVVAAAWAEIVAFAEPAADLSAAPPGPEAAAAAVVGVTRGLADGLEPNAAAATMRDMADAFAATAPGTLLSASAIDEAANGTVTDTLARLAALTAYAEALARRSYRSRPDGVSARGEASARFEAEMELCIGAADAELFLAISALRGSVVDFLTRLTADLAPVVTVDTPRPLPSLVLAWRLYTDPQRSTELVDRNRVQHPSFMPRELQALAF